MATTGSDHDDTALARFAAGDPAEDVFECAVPALTGMIRGYLMWFGARNEAVEDLAQEALVRVYLHRGRRNGTSVPALRGWVQALCRNLVIDSARCARTEPVTVVPARPEGSMRDVRRHLEQCIVELREPDATVFRLRYDLGWAPSRIAQLFGWKVRNCELVLARAKATVGLCLRRKGYDIKAGS